MNTDKDRVNILVVDDQPEGLLALEATLAPLGQNLVKASSGREALRLLLTADYAAILLDVVMPQMDGFETALLIRERERNRHTPIIFLTALGSGELPLLRAYSVGAVDYLLKPFEPEILRSKVSVFVDLAKQRELIRVQEQKLREIQQREHERELAEAIRRIEEERNRAREELLHREVESSINQQRWLEAILDAMPTALVLLDLRSGLPQFANEAARELASGAFVSVEPPAAGELSGPGGEPLAAAQLPTARVARGERLTGVQFNWRRGLRTGSVLAFSEALPEMLGHPPVALLALLDVTELADAKEDLQRAVRIRDDFLSVASHELKTPLTSIKMNVQRTLLGVESGRPEQLTQVYLTDRLRMLDRNVSRLAGLVDNLLDISRISSGRLELELGEVDLAAVTREVVNRFQDELTRAGCELNLRLSDNVVGHWDRGRLDQVLTNLIGNAIKYAPGKPVHVAVKVEGERARLEVRDEGVGIAPEHHARIFARFERIAHARNVSGFGLGLWIVKQIVSAMGGGIDVRSAEGQGATFVVSLPLGVRTAAAANEKVAARASA